MVGSVTVSSFRITVTARSVELVRPSPAASEVLVSRIGRGLSIVTGWLKHNGSGQHRGGG